MEDELTAGHGSLQRIRLTQVAQSGFGFQFGDVVGAAAGTYKQAQVRTLLRQRMGNMATDKPGGSCKEDFHALSLSPIAALVRQPSGLQKEPRKELTSLPQFSPPGASSPFSQSR